MIPDVKGSLGSLFYGLLYILQRTLNEMIIFNTPKGGVILTTGFSGYSTLIAVHRKF